MATRLGHSGRIFGVLLCLIAWLLVSNHCALATLHPLKSQAHNCCEKKAPEKSSRASFCCQTLPTTEQVNLSLPFPTVFPTLTLLPTPVDLDLHSSQSDIIPVRVGDPPGNASQLDLERCHPAIAPPAVI